MTGAAEGLEGASPPSAPVLPQINRADAAVADEQHPPGHQVTLDCPIGCVGVETVGDLVRALYTSAAQLTNGSAVRGVCHQVEMACSLTCLNLPVRVRNALAAHEHEVRTVADLMAYLRAGALAEVPGIGNDSVRRVKQVLIDAGFSKEHYPYLKQEWD